MPSLFSARTTNLLGVNVGIASLNPNTNAVVVAEVEVVTVSSPSPGGTLPAITLNLVSVPVAVIGMLTAVRCVTVPKNP